MAFHRYFALTLVSIQISPELFCTDRFAAKRVGDVDGFTSFAFLSDQVAAVVSQPKGLAMTSIDQQLVRRPPTLALDADPGVTACEARETSARPNRDCLDRRSDRRRRRRCPARQRISDRVCNRDEIQQPEVREHKPAGIEKIV